MTPCPQGNISVYEKKNPTTQKTKTQDTVYSYKPPGPFNDFIAQASLINLYISNPNPRPKSGSNASESREKQIGKTESQQAENFSLMASAMFQRCVSTNSVVDMHERS